MIRRLPLILFIAAMLALGWAIAEPVLAAVPNADLRVRLASTDVFPDAGQQVIARAEVKNLGPDDAADAVLTVNFDTYTFDGFCTPHFSPPGVLVCDPIATPANCVVGADSFTCDYPVVTDGQRILLGFRLTALESPGVRLNGTVTSATRDPVLTNNHAVAYSTLP